VINPKKLEELTEQLQAALPESLQNVEKDIQQKFHAVLQAAFAKMALVTREEFDVQTKVLARTREKVEQLQQRLDALLAKKS